MWEDYTVPCGTYRENLLRTPGQSLAPKGHPATQFRYDVLKDNADERGNITINRSPKKPEAVAPTAKDTSIIGEKTVPLIEKTVEVKVEV
jgi:hypothetical protein